MITRKHLAFSWIAAVALVALTAGCGPGETSDTTDAELYNLIEETIEDMPIKVQIVQHVVATSAPTAEQLEAEVLARYNALQKRSGFTHHRNPTNIYIYIYGTEEQARAAQGLWVAMLAKSFHDTAQPPVTINRDRLAALTAEPEVRAGLSEEDRKRLFAEIGKAEHRATDEAMSRIPDTQVMEQIELEQALAEQYKEELAAEYGLTLDELFSVTLEGVQKGWPYN